jgi:transcriptional regulator with XRE-family HTH domain
MQTSSSAQELQASLGRQVRALRLAANLSQGALAQQAGVALGALKSLEVGGCANLRTLTCVAQALGRSQWLLSLEPSFLLSALDMAAPPRPTRLRASKARPPA